MQITPIVVGKSKEGLDALHVLGHILVLHNFDLHFSETDSNYSHLLPKELDAIIMISHFNALANN